MPQSERDVLTLLDATLTMKEEHDETPVITMSMGHKGVISRICGEASVPVLPSALPAKLRHRDSCQPTACPYS